MGAAQPQEALVTASFIRFGTRIQDPGPSLPVNQSLTVWSFCVANLREKQLFLWQFNEFPFFRL